MKTSNLQGWLSKSVMFTRCTECTDKIKSWRNDDYMEMLTKEQVSYLKKNEKLMYKFLTNEIKVDEDDYIDNEHAYIDISDWHGVVFESMIRAIKNYDVNKGKFSTFFYSIAHNAVAYEKRRIRLYNKRNVLDKYDNTELFNNNGYEEYGYRLLELTDGIEGRLKEILDLRLAGYTNREIASELGIHRSTVVREMRVVRDIIRDNL